MQKGKQQPTAHAAHTAQQVPAPEMHEAPFSANWRMAFNGELFQFTVRHTSVQGLHEGIAAVIEQAIDNGYAWAQDRTAAPARAAQQPQAASPQNTYQAPAAPPVAPQAAHPDARMKMEMIDGFVVGSYHSKRDNGMQPCVHAFVPGLQFKKYTIYPETFGVLPFAVPTDNLPMGSAPSRDQSQARGMWIAAPAGFKLAVEMEIDKEGAPVLDKGGRPLFRVCKVQPPGGVLPQASVPPTGQAAPAPAPATQHPVVPFSYWPEVEERMDAPTEESFSFSMVYGGFDDAGHMPLEMAQWLVAYRENVVAYLPANGRKTNQNEWDLLCRWSADQVGADTYATVEYEGVHMKHASLLCGVLCDIFVERPGEIPAAATLHILSRVMQKRGGQANPDYDQVTAGAFAHILRHLTEVYASNE